MKKLLFSLIIITIMLAGCGSDKGNDAVSESESAVEATVAAQTDVPTETVKTEKGDSPLSIIEYGSGYNGQYLTEEPVEKDFPDSGLYIRYAVNSKEAGKIDGTELQKLTSGGKTGKVTAKASLGYRFVSWSDGVTSPSRSGDTASESMIITAIFDYDVLDLPVMLIDTETGRDVESKEYYINGSMSVIGCDEKWSFDGVSMEIRGRGNNTWGYPKKSYKFKLTEKRNLFDLAAGKERVWVLLANHCDQSLLRNHFSLELGRCLGGIDWSPASMSVEVYLNGEYRGVYLLSEEIKTSGDRVNITENTEAVDTGYLIELSNYASGDVFNAGGRTYRVASDLSEKDSVKKLQLDYIEDYIEKCWKAVQGGDKDKIAALVDIDSCIDCYIVEEISRNLDQGWDSFYLYRDAGGTLHLGPMWDFDLSFGNSDSGCEYYDGIHAATTAGSGGGNPWFYTLMYRQWFRDLVYERWTEVFDIVSELPDIIRSEGEYGYASYCRNFEKWKIFGTSQNRETHFITSLKNYKEHYEYLAQWAADRIEWLDGYYKSDDYKKGAFTGNIESSGNTAYANDESERIVNAYDSLNEFVDIDSLRAPDGFGGEGVENLFDESNSTKYCWQSEGETVITFSTDKKITVKAYALATANDTEQYSERNPDGWEFYGSTDGKNWTLIDSHPKGATEMTTRNYTLNAFECGNTTAYDRYKIVITDSETCQLGEWRLLG